MSAGTLVVDASAIVPLLMSTGMRGEHAATRVSESVLHAPDHLPVEVTNVLRRQRNGGLIESDVAAEVADAFWTLRIQLWPLYTLHDRVWQLGANLSSYDAAYVALAERLHAPLLTADARLARAPGIRCPVELLD